MGRKMSPERKGIRLPRMKSVKTPDGHQPPPEVRESLDTNRCERSSQSKLILKSKRSDKKNEPSPVRSFLTGCKEQQPQTNVKRKALTSPQRQFTSLVKGEMAKETTPSEKRLQGEGSSNQNVWKWYVLSRRPLIL